MFLKMILSQEHLKYLQLLGVSGFFLKRGQDRKDNKYLLLGK